MTLITRVLFIVAMVTVHGAAMSRQLADIFKRFVTQTAVEILISLLKKVGQFIIKITIYLMTA